MMMYQILMDDKEIANGENFKTKNHVYHQVL